MVKKIGVYICACGGNISDYVDIEKVKKAIESEEGVFLAKTTMFACGDSNQKEMSDDIQTSELNGFVVASCSPKLNLPTFRGLSERSGLNKYNYVHANIREQASWAHSDDKEGATEKAIHIVKAAIAKARHTESLDPIFIESKDSVAVVGAGVVGLKAALSIAEMRTTVYLIEKDHFVGGYVKYLDIISPENESGRNLIKRLYNEVINNNKITLFTGAEIIEQQGNIGDFRIKVKKHSRCFSSDFVKEEVSAAINICPIEVPDKSTGGLRTKKAINENYFVDFPAFPAIDNDLCTCCGACEKVCKSIKLNQNEELIDLNVGSVLIATGFDSYTPEIGEFGFNTITNVITLPQFKDLISRNSERLFFNGKEIKNIAYIYCVGSRQVKGENKFCSRYCCTANIQTAIDAKTKFPSVQNYHFTRGVRTYGKQELIYRDALSQGDLFFQSADKQAPDIIEENGTIHVKINDILSAKRKLDLNADLVVLVTGMVPKSNSTIGSLFKLPKGRDLFFNEIHMKLRPVETVIDGITIAGTCQGPKNVMESMNSALAASIKSHSIVSKGKIELEPIIAYINKAVCTGCNECTEACPYSAIVLSEENGMKFAAINNSTCKGCGMCLPVCPTDAIDLKNYSNIEIESMIDLLAK